MQTILLLANHFINENYTTRVPCCKYACCLEINWNKSTLLEICILHRRTHFCSLQTILLTRKIYESILEKYALCLNLNCYEGTFLEICKLPRRRHFRSLQIILSTRKLVSYYPVGNRQIAETWTTTLVLCWKCAPCLNVNYYMSTRGK